jgi:fermentation-respiration switch protein FrsA (DUF1100 family)
MTKTPKFIHVFKVFCLLLIAYASVLGYLYCNQAALIFQPDDNNPFLHDHKPFQSFIYETPMGLKEQGLWFPPDEHMPLIVMFHGNGGSVANRFGRAEKFLARGYGVALVEYRGYGGNPGVPGEDNFMEDARAAIIALHDKGILFKDMVFYGESLGTGVAIHMATEAPGIKALVLESPYTSIADVAAHRFWYLPVSHLVHDRFDSAALIGSVKTPLLVIHGTADSIIPFENGKQLFSLATMPTKEFVAIQGGEHSNLYDYQADEIIDHFLRKIK